MEHLRTLNLPQRTMTVQIDESKCVGPFECGRCLKSCPANVVITFPKERVRGEVCDEWNIVANETYCWGCGACPDLCPKNAIAISEIVE